MKWNRVASIPGETSGMIFEAILNRAPTPPYARILQLRRIWGESSTRHSKKTATSAISMLPNCGELKRLRRDTTSGKTESFDREEPTPVRRKRTYAIWAAVAMVPLLIGVVLYRFRMHSGPPASSEWVQLTSFVDSATSPALSPDGRMLVFLRGPSTFAGRE